MIIKLIVSVLLNAGTVVAAQAQKTEEWNVSSPPGELREISLDVRSGTWMSLDVSPDGKRIVFDLLGDLYELPIDGGAARALTSGMAWDMQPRYSPDGRSIAFTSDRAGGNNLWVMDAGGDVPRQVSKESFRLLSNPAWHPSGRYVVGRKLFTTRRSLGTGEIWLYSLDGGDGVQLIKRPNEEYQKELGEPALSRNGRYLYFTQNATPGDQFEYAQDVNKGVFHIRRLELASGKIDVAVSGPGGAVHPMPSPDGAYLAFVRRLRTASALETGLFLKELNSGEERLLYGNLDRDLQETWGVYGMYPNMAWMPDSGSILFWAGGGIKRVAIASGAVQDIPFHVVDKRTSIVAGRFEVSAAPDEVRSQMVRFASISPQGQYVVFEAFGRLWLKSLSGGEARRLTRDESPALELFPSWSRDGRNVVFVRWTDAGLGAIHVVSSAGGRSRAVTGQPGHYVSPRFSPDGATLVFERAVGGTLTSPLWSSDPGLYRVASSGGPMQRLVDKGRNAHFAASGSRIYYTEDAQPEKETEPAHELVSIDTNGKDRRVHARARYASRMEISPDGAWLAFRENFNVYVVPVPPGGSVELSLNLKALPLVRVSESGGNYFSWVDGGSLAWTAGSSLYRAELNELYSARTVVDGARRSGRIADLSIALPADKPVGVVALTGARIITMNGADEIIDRGTIVIRDNRILAIGPSTAVAVPRDAKRLDLAGRTVMPGFIDVHAHPVHSVNEIVPQQNWSTLGHLAFGVTTLHDPFGSMETFVQAEYQRAGIVISPRIFSTGEGLYGAHSERFASIETLTDARQLIGRLQANGRSR